MEQNKEEELKPFTMDDPVIILRYPPREKQPEEAKK